MLGEKQKKSESGGYEAMDFRFEQLCGSVKTYLAGLNQRELMMARPREEEEEQKKTLDLEIFSFSSEKKERDARE